MILDHWAHIVEVYTDAGEQPEQGPLHDGTPDQDSVLRAHLYQRRNQAQGQVVGNPSVLGKFRGVVQCLQRLLGDMERQAEAPKLKIKFQKGESVKIKEGPFENFDGVVDEVYPEKGLVRVVVTIFSRPTPVELEYWQVEPI